uniref:Uncharacterized protein n=1 Tax=Aegilops tauschii subsp. strangulata TaxID=200361 RepID=A0A453C1I7_AEGTS
LRKYIPITRTTFLWGVDEHIELKKRGEAEPSQDDMGRPSSSCAKDLTISEGTGATFLFNFHSRVSICFHALF